MEHWQADLTISPDFIASNPVYVAESDGDLRGFYALVIERRKSGTGSHVGGAAHIGTGVGKQLFLHAMQHAAGKASTQLKFLPIQTRKASTARREPTESVKYVSEIDGEPRILPRLIIDPKSET